MRNKYTVDSEIIEDFYFFKTILLSPKAIEKDDLYKFARPWLGTGLFTAPGESF